MRVLVVIGTRPEAIKLFPLVHALRSNGAFDVTICETGQHPKLTRDVLDFAGIDREYSFDLDRSANTPLVAVTAELLTKLDDVIARETPDWVVVQGDTQSALVGAMAGHYRRVRIAHVEAGLRSGDLSSPWPEEANRRMIAQIASLHFAPTPASGDALVSEGVAKSSIVVTGNTIVDALDWTRRRIAADRTITPRADEIIANVNGRKLALVTAHRRESWGEGIASIVRAVANLSRRDDTLFVWPLHANPAVRDEVKKKLDDEGGVVLTEPLDYPNFVRLLSEATLVLTDSGGIQEEAPSFGVPVLVMRDTTERQEGVEAGTARLVGTKPDAIVRLTNDLLDGPDMRSAMTARGNPFGDGQASRRIVEALLGAG